MNPLIDNILIIAFQAFGENVVEIKNLENILFGTKMNILQFVESFASIFKMLGIPFIKDLYEMVTNFGAYHISNNSIGFVKVIFGNEFGPFEYYRHTINGRKVNEIKSIYGSKYLSKFYFKLPIEFYFLTGNIQIIKHHAT